MVESYELHWTGISKVVIQRNYTVADNIYKLAKRKGDLKSKGLKIFGKQIIQPTFYKEDMYLIDPDNKLRTLEEIKKFDEILELHTIKFDDEFKVNEITKEIEFKPYVCVTSFGHIKTYFFNSGEDIDKFLKDPENEDINKFIDQAKKDYY